MPDAVAMQIGPVTAAARRDSLGKDFEHCVKVLAGQIAVRVRPEHGPEQVVLVPLFAGAHGHDLLSQDVQRRVRNLELVEFTLPQGSD